MSDEAATLELGERIGQLVLWLKLSMLATAIAGGVIVWMYLQILDGKKVDAEIIKTLATQQSVVDDFKPVRARARWWERHMDKGNILVISPEYLKELEDAQRADPID